MGITLQFNGYFYDRPQEPRKGYYLKDSDGARMLTLKLTESEATNLERVLNELMEEKNVLDVEPTFKMQRFVLMVSQRNADGWSHWWLERQANDAEYLETWAKGQIGQYRNLDGENRRFDAYRVVDMVGGGVVGYAN